jgi:glycosyltransferase involved in cell wall biosynthesis
MTSVKAEEGLPESSTGETLSRLVVPPAGRTEQPLVDIVIPVYNEERVLAASVRSLRSYLDSSFPFSTVVTIVDNGSTDSTASIAAQLAGELEGVRSLRLEDKGRGRALRSAWARSEAQVVAYMDVDLSSSLNALLPLVAPVLSDHSVISIGSRLAHGAHIVRSRKRDRISRAYNLLLRVLLHSGFSDAQCGFKAASADVARRLLPEVQDDDWFFDTELLFRAQRHGLRINEVPVDWVEDPDSRVDIVPTVVEDLRGIARLLRDRFSGPASSVPLNVGNTPASSSTAVSS